MKDLQSDINQLHGRLIGQQLVLQIVLSHSPQAISVLRSIDPQNLESLLMARPMSDESIRSAQDQIALLLDLGA